MHSERLFCCVLSAIYRIFRLWVEAEYRSTPYLEVDKSTKKNSRHKTFYFSAGNLSKLFEFASGNVCTSLAMHVAEHCLVALLIAGSVLQHVVLGTVEGVANSALLESVHDHFVGKCTPSLIHPSANSSPEAACAAGQLACADCRRPSTHCKVHVQGP